MPSFQQAIAESFRFAAAVLVWLLINKWVPDSDTLIWQAVSAVGTALIAGLVTYLALAIVFCRSQIESRWFIENEEIPGSMPELPFSGSGVASLRLDVRGSHKSVVHKLVELILRKELTFCIDYIFKPADTLRYKRQNGPNARFARNVLTVTCDQGIWIGQMAWVDFNVERLQTSSLATEIALQTRVHSSNIRWISRALVKIHAGKQGFVLRG